MIAHLGDINPADRSRPALRDGSWSIDPQHSAIGFAVKDMWGARTVRGAFSAYEGTLRSGPNGAAGELTIEAASLDTGNRRRDRHLRSPAFFDVEQHPRIVFSTTAVSDRDGLLAIAGELAIGSSRVRLEIPVTVERTPAGALRLEGSANVSRAAAGLAWNVLGMIRGDAMLRAELTLEPATRKENEMSDLDAVADRVEIEALRGEFTDAVMMRDYDRLASLFTPEGVVRMPHINAAATGRDGIRSGVERMQGLWDYFVQNTHPGTIQLDGDTAYGRAYISELMHGHAGSHLNYAVYHDRYQRAPDGWKFSERVYEVRYLDTTPLAGSGPDVTGAR